MGEWGVSFDVLSFRGVDVPFVSIGGGENASPNLTGVAQTRLKGATNVNRWKILFCVSTI